MSTHNIRVAFNALAASGGSLISATAAELDQHHITWTPFRRPLSLSVSETRGVWKLDDGSPLRFTVLGVIDASRSHLSSYGNCTWDRKERDFPSYKDLLKARFSIDVTHPYLPVRHADEDISAGLMNQLYRLEDIKTAATAQLLAQGHPPPLRVTEWVHFHHSPHATAGWMRIYLGHVYEYASGTGGLPVEDDPNMFLVNAAAHGLTHNSAIPCYTSAGSHIGRTGAQLRSELYNGRWVQVEVEMAIWYLEKERTVVYRLDARRLETLDSPPGTIAVFDDMDPAEPGDFGAHVLGREVKVEAVVLPQSKTPATSSMQPVSIDRAVARVQF